MKFHIRDIPQANNLDVVIRSVDAIAKGARSDLDIAAFIGYKDRQGRYYRTATELLGFTERIASNNSQLTDRGRELVKANGNQRNALLADAILGCALVQQVIPFLEAKRTSGFTKSDIDNFVKGIAAHTGPTMVPRRTSTLLSWLKGIGILNQKSGRYYLSQLPQNIPLIEFQDPSQPLLPREFTLQEYVDVRTKVSDDAGLVSYMVDKAKTERSMNAHRLLTNIVAERLRSIGCIPRSNSFVDLAAVIADTPYIFEMKSNNPSNTHHQIRRGLSQLYEYRYLQSAPTACLVLVLENPVPDEKYWLIDYLIEDR
jgi:hypothetical protein